MNIKYSILLFPSGIYFPKNIHEYSFDEQTALKYATLEQILSAEQLKHWKEWLGEVEWERMKRFNVQVRSWVPTSTPGVLDKDNQTLFQKSSAWWDALTLTLPLIISGKPIVASGDGVWDGQAIAFSDVRQISRLRRWVYSDFMEANGYNKWLQSIDERQAFEKWGEIGKFLIGGYSQAPNFHLFSLAVQSFSYGLEAHWVDFRVPNFIRAVESVISVSSNHSAKDFARKVSVFVPQSYLDLLGATRASLISRLEEMYQIRSDCVHGRPFAYTRQKRARLEGEELKNRIAEDGFLAEICARAVLQAVVFHPAFHDVLGDRAKLDKVWKKGGLPPAPINLWDPANKKP